MRTVLCLLLVLWGAGAFAQNETDLIRRVKARIDRVSNYSASGRMKVDVTFINAPESDVMVYFKKPNKFKVEKKDGISLLPKGGVSVNMGALLPSDNYTAVAAGTATVGGTPTTIIKLLPSDEKSDVVLTTLYIDGKNEVIRKAAVTTRENGTYEMDLQYGKYTAWGLPDKVVFSFNAKDYKLPKGITFEYEKGGKKDAKPKDAKGRVEITYKQYTINKGVDDKVFEK